MTLSLTSLLKVESGAGLAHNDQKVIDYLKKSGLPVVIYGAGDVGQRIANKLKEQSIDFTFAVDAGCGEYPTPVQIDKTYAAYDLIKGSRFAWGNDCSQFRNARSRLMLIDIYGLEYIDIGFFREHFSAFEQTFNMLEDDLSRETMFRHLRALFECDVNSAQEIMTMPTYFIQGVYRLPEKPVFVDCGTYDGDTVAQFIKLYPDYGKIICFEPSPSNFSTLESRVKPLRDIEIYKAACSDSPGILRFMEEDNSQSGSLNKNGTIEVPTVKLDDSIGVPPVDMIKMDIEGAELSALMGARDVIVRDKPVLALCVYHKKNDLITIPQYLKTLVPEYKFYFRTHGIFIETVLYAVSPKYVFRAGN